MSDIVTEARALLDEYDAKDHALRAAIDAPSNADGNDPDGRERAALQAFERAESKLHGAAPRLVRGLLAEVERLRDGGSMASAPRKDAAPTAAEPAVLHTPIDPPAIAQGEIVDSRFCARHQGQWKSSGCVVCGLMRTAQERDRLAAELAQERARAVRQ